MEQKRLLAERRVRSSVRVSSFLKEDTENSISARFEKQAALYPLHVAVRRKGVEITYEAFNRSANRIARAIAAECEGGTDRIALLFGHDAAALVAMIGVLKSGRAYVPIDPSYPPSRVDYIMEDSQSDLIATNNDFFSLAKKLASERCKVINIDEIASGTSHENQDFSVPADAIAYILYTSGSTGQPKGVIQTHRNLLHFIRSYSNSLGINAHDRLSLLPSFSFSASLMDIYGALLNGAMLCPFGAKEEGTARLAEWLIDEGITVYHSVPTLFRHLLSDIEGENQFPDIRLIDLGGEPVAARDLELFRKYFSRRCILVNHLAFTEASVVAQYFVDHDTEIIGNNVPAGYAADGIGIVLLDDKGQLVKVGETGEIAVRSDYLSPGYWRKPELTDAAFLRDPQGQGIIYRTGDLGRMHSGGFLEHLGRKDFRVKIRGYSIEVAEIESALLKSGVAKEAVVAVKEDKEGDPRLVAYVVPAGQPLPAVSEIRGILSRSLPDYMVPAVFVEMKALPLTPSGKVDRLALPHPGDALCGRERDIVAPRNKVEQRLVKVWERILGVPRVGIGDNFFDLGGHSLLAARVVAQIRKKMGKDIPEDVLLQAPTVAQLAEVIDSYDPSASWPALVPVYTSGSRPPFFWVYGGAKAFLQRYLGPAQPIYALVHQSQDGRRALYTTIEEMASYYLREIKGVQSEGPYFLGGYCFGGVVALEMAQQLRSEGQDVPLLCLVEPQGRCLHTIKPPKVLQPRFRNLGPHEKFAHLLKMIKRMGRERIKMARQRLLGALCESYLRLGRPLPHRLRKGYLKGIHKRALKAYEPRFYSGKVAIFSAGNLSRSRPRDYTRLSADVEVHEVQGADHLSIIRKQYVGIWAEQVNRYLQEIHENSRAKEK